MILDKEYWKLQSKGCVDIQILMCQNAESFDKPEAGVDAEDKQRVEVKC
jgi:hypothetical protein